MRGKIGGLLAIACATALPCAALAADLASRDSCSLADVHAAQPADSTIAGEAEDAAIAVEALRALPAVHGAPAAPRPAEPSTAAPESYAAHVDLPGYLASAHTERLIGPPEPQNRAFLDVSRSAAGDAGANSLDDLPIGYRDYRAPKERFRALRELKVLRLWDTTAVQVWFGLDRKGRPGLHFRQRNPDEEMPTAKAAPLVEAPPLRSVPLTSP